MRPRLAAFFALSLCSMTALADDGVQPLPAGLWYLSGHYEYEAIPAPAGRTPTVAAIVGTYQTASEVARGLRVLSRSRLALGYPWAVSNHDLRMVGQCDESVVVVAGLFASESDANAWRAAAPERAVTRIVAIATNDDPEGSCSWPYGTEGFGDAHGRRLTVVVVDPSEDAPAYAMADVDAVDYSRQYGSARATTIASLTPVCTIPRGSVFVRTTSGRLYGWATGRCNGREVVIPAEHTLTFSVVEERSPGVGLLHQVTAVECDVPGIDTWQYSRAGRTPVPGHPPTFLARCGG